MGKNFPPVYFGCKSRCWENFLNHSAASATLIAQAKKLHKLWLPVENWSVWTSGLCSALLLSVPHALSCCGQWYLTLFLQSKAHLHVQLLLFKAFQNSEQYNAHPLLAAQSYGKTSSASGVASTAVFLLLDCGELSFSGLPTNQGTNFQH